MAATEDGEAVVGIASTETRPSVSATANVEKWDTTKEHMHCPFVKILLQRDISTGTALRSPALASEIANPYHAESHQFAQVGARDASLTFMFLVALKHWSTGTYTGRVSDTPPERVSTMVFGLMEMRGLRSFPDEKSVSNEPA